MSFLTGSLASITQLRVRSLHTQLVSQISKMSTPYQPMDFTEAKALARTSAETSGLVLLKEKRHVTLGWHMTGNGYAGLANIFEATLGKYKDSLKGVPVAIGPIKPKGSSAHVIDDHSCMHLDVTATFVVFVPKIGATYEAEVTKVDNTTVTAKMYDIITIIAKKDKRLKYPIGHVISVKIDKIVISRNMCQLRGKIVGTAQEPSEAIIKKRKRRSALENVFSKRNSTNAAPANHTKFEEEDDQEETIADSLES